MTREEAVEFVKRNGPLPDAPDATARTCGHAGTDRPCSCHLTLVQHAAAAALGNYTLFLFGRPYRGRVKVPYYGGPGGMGGDEVHAMSMAELARVTHHVGRRRKRAVVEVTTAGAPSNYTRVADAEVVVHRRFSEGAAPPRSPNDPAVAARWARWSKLKRVAKAAGPDALAKFKTDWKAGIYDRVPEEATA